jgi:negative regulator of flagellin synthesis FlgM
MAIDFPGLSPAQAAGNRGKVSEQQTPATGSTAGPPQADNASARNDDTVRISDTAQALRRSVGENSGSADVNSDRIAQIKAAIDDGSYKINNERIADSMLQFESLLG